MAKIAVVGVGAVGGVVASAFLGRVGHSIQLCSRRGFDRLSVRLPGEQASSSGTSGPTVRQQAVQVATDPDGIRPARWVILATKAHQTAETANWLARLCTPDTTVAVLQNGVEHIDRVAPIAGPARVLPVIVDCPATRSQPGQITCYRAPRIVVPNSDDGRAFAALLDTVGIAGEIAEDFATAAWRKLCVNVVSGSIPALCDQPRGVFRNPEITELTRALVAECIAVGRKEGADLDEDMADRVVAQMRGGDPDSLTSMLVDRRSGIALECDARNGAVVRIGARHGVPTPLNRAVNALLSAVNVPYPR